MLPIYKVTDYGVIANLGALQTEALQAVFDLCRVQGGTIVLPEGRYYTGGLRMWSDTTLYLERGAMLIGSDRCEDYPVFEVPEGVELRTDMELITQYYDNRPWETYRRAILSVYGGKNIAVIGEEGSRIDGQDCTDPAGEEGYRGPHGLFITNVENLTMKGYTISNCGNFMHQIDNCRNITMRSVTCTGGSDGIHLHHCRHTLIEDCIFHTGDDCIAGINMQDLHVKNCELNTSCDVFRAGGSDILVEDCHIWGPGIYPHRMTVVQNRGTELVRQKSNTLPRSQGRHNTINVYIHFASTNFPNPAPYRNVCFKNCLIENADRFLEYSADDGPLQSGTHLAEIALENVTFTGLLTPSQVKASPIEPLTVRMSGVSATLRDGTTGKVFDGLDPNTMIQTK